MPDLKPLRRNGLCLFAALTILLSCVLATSYASPRRGKTIATYYCDINSQGKARLDFTLLSKTPLTEEQKSSLEKALGLQLSNRLTRYESDEPEEMGEDLEGEMSEEEYAEETDGQQQTYKNQRNLFLFGAGTRYFSKQAFRIETDFDLSDVIQILRDLKIDTLQVSISHTETAYSDCTKSTNSRLPENLNNHFHTYMIALSDGETEPSVIHIAYGYPTSFLVKKLSIMGVIFLLPILFIAWKRRTLTGQAAVDSSAARYSAFRALNMLTIGFPLVWLMSFSLVGVNEAFSFIETGRGAIYKLMVTVIWYMLFPTINLLICKALLYPFLTNADDKRFKVKDFVEEALILVFGTFLPLLFLLSGFVAIVGGKTALGLGYFAANYVSKLIAKPLQKKTQGAVAFTLVVKSLRDRVFEIASRAGVNLREVYVLPLDKDKTANAFATTKNTVLLNEYLLRRMSRREVDAVVAHEIGHLRLNHPRMLTLSFYIGFIIPIFLPFFLQLAITYLGSFSIKFLYLSAYLHNSDFLFPISIGISTLIFLLLSRRFEYSADAFAVTVTGDAEAMITALIRLARLNLLPMDWGKLDENLLTHPSTMNRIKSLANQYGVSTERLTELIHAPVEPEDTYSLQETAAPLTKPAENSYRPAPAYQANTNLPKQTKKRALKYLRLPFHATFFAMLFLFFLLRQVPVLKKYAQMTGLSPWLIVLLGGAITLLISSYAIKRMILRSMPTKIQYFRTHAKMYPALDVSELDRYTEELTKLGFEHSIDYTFDLHINSKLQGFARLFAHPQQNCFAEIGQIFAGSISVTPLKCTLASSIVGGWYFSTTDRETLPLIYANRMAQSLFETKLDANVSQLFQAHLSRRNDIVRLLGSEVANDTSFEAYLTTTANLGFVKRERLRKKNSFLYLLELERCERNPKSVWFGKLEKQFAPNNTGHLVESKVRT